MQETVSRIGIGLLLFDFLCLFLSTLLLLGRMKRDLLWGGGLFS